MVQGKLQNGLIKQKLFDTKAKAMEWEAQMKTQTEWATMNQETKIVTALEWANEYLDYSQERFSTKTYLEKQDCFARFFKTNELQADVATLSTSQSMKYLRQQSRERSGHATNKDRKNLTAAWEWERRYLAMPTTNPFRAVDKFAEVNKPRHVPTKDDFWRLYSHTTGQDKLILLVLLHTAARKGEVFRLKWSDLDFDSKRIRLWTCKRKNGSMEADWIPMTEDLHIGLQSHKKQASSVFVFVRPDNGQPYKHRQHWMKGLCGVAEVPKFDIYSIRHLTASILDDAGLPLTTIQAILRHKSATTTARYLHSLRGIKVALDEVFSSDKVFPLSSLGTSQCAI